MNKVLGTCTALVAISVTASAGAYDYNTHGRLPEEAVVVMDNVGKGSLDTSIPNGVDAAKWNAFIASVRNARPRLELLRTGLPTALPRFVQENTTPFPYAAALSRLPCASHVDGTNLNLDNLGALRILALETTSKKFKPKRQGETCVGPAHEKGLDFGGKYEG